MKKNEAAVELGKLGGKATSTKKTIAVRKNAKKPRRRKWVTAIAYVIEIQGEEHRPSGLIMTEGKMQDDPVEATKWAEDAIAKQENINKAITWEVCELEFQSMLV